MPSRTSPWETKSSRSPRRSTAPACSRRMSRCQRDSCNDGHRRCRSRLQRPHRLPTSQRSMRCANSPGCAQGSRCSCTRQRAASGWRRWRCPGWSVLRSLPRPGRRRSATASTRWASSTCSTHAPPSSPSRSASSRTDPGSTLCSTRSSAMRFPQGCRCSPAGTLPRDQQSATCPPTHASTSTPIKNNLALHVIGLGGSHRTGARVRVRHAPEVVVMLANGRLAPLPTTVTPIDRAAETFPHHGHGGPHRQTRAVGAR